MLRIFLVCNLAICCAIAPAFIRTPSKTLGKNPSMFFRPIKDLAKDVCGKLSTNNFNIDSCISLSTPLVCNMFKVCPTKLVSGAALKILESVRRSPGSMVSIDELITLDSFFNSICVSLRSRFDANINTT